MHRFEKKMVYMPLHFFFFSERRPLQRSDYYQFKVKDQREDDGLPPIGPVTNKPRRQRPMSFDEKELQHNINVVKTRRRPYSFDERELQRNEAVNAQIRSKSHGEAFTKPARPIVIPTSGEEEDAHSTRGNGEVRISLVNASDLYELVDIKRMTKRDENTDSRDGTVKLVNVPDAVQFVQDIEPNKGRNGHRRDDVSLQLKPDSVDSKHQVKKVRHIKINVNSNKNVLGKNESANVKNTNNHRSETEIERVTPMGLFLQQAVSDFANQNALNVRPKRAKRMSLRKPRLLDIPEDGDSLLQSEREIKLEPTSYNYKVRQPSGTSLQAIKEVREFKQEDNVEGPVIGLESGRLTQRQRLGEVAKRAEAPSLSSKSSTRKIKHRQANKLSQPSLDIDKLLMTSIYPTVSWNSDGTSDQPSTRSPGLHERSSHKEKAHRKMKKLIFLRDRPDQHYRKDT